MTSFVPPLTIFSLIIDLILITYSYLSKKDYEKKQAITYSLFLPGGFCGTQGVPLATVPSESSKRAMSFVAKQEYTCARVRIKFKL